MVFQRLIVAWKDEAEPAARCEDPGAFGERALWIPAAREHVGGRDGTVVAVLTGQFLALRELAAGREALVLRAAGCCVDQVFVDVDRFDVRETAAFETGVYQPPVPGSPLQGPTISGVIQPP